MSETLYRHDRTDAGLDLIRLHSALVELAIVPSAGGKIVELTDRRSSRNWLWQNAHVPVCRARHDADFERELDSGGWDEVLFSVKPRRIHSGDDRMLAIPDHGDLIRSEWRVEDLQVTSSGDVVCDMTASGHAASYRFARRIRLPCNDAAVEFDYVLENKGGAPLPYYWCAHPLLAVEPDARIEIAGQMPFRVDDAATQQLSDSSAAQYWPTLLLRDGKSVNVSQSFARNSARRPLACKLFLQSPPEGSVSLVQGGASLTFRFDPQALPWLGLWINNGAWSGCGSEPYTNLGIEPATAPYDCVNEAIDNDSVPWLVPGERRQWSLRVELRL